MKKETIKTRSGKTVTLRTKCLTKKQRAKCSKKDLEFVKAMGTLARDFIRDFN